MTKLIRQGMYVRDSNFISLVNVRTVGTSAKRKAPGSEG